VRHAVSDAHHLRREIDLADGGRAEVNRERARDPLGTVARSSSVAMRSACV
jgi:hypothetical protein